MILKLEKISRTYFNESGNRQRIILNNLDLQVNSGEKIAIVGPSGSGKTTLLNLIGTLDKADSGKIFVEGIDIAELNDKKLAEFRNKKIGFVFQLHHLLPQLTLTENILLPTLADKNHHSKEASIRAQRLINRLGLSAVAHQRPAELSGGECQRTAVARALINQPKLLLADEPTGALDHQSAFNLVDLLAEVNSEEGVALIVVTHSMEVAQKMDTIYSLEDGRLLTLKK
ncbi:MAG: ABC transporter ATP-binding protein [Prolixibacteraceae bacterium]